MAGTAREEAERLVAAVLAMAGHSARGGGGAWATGAWATGSAECCVCPVCRVIASVRDPHPVTVERLATGAGDLATGLASVMRAVSAMAGNTRPARTERPPAPPPNPDTTWSTATRTADHHAEPGDRPASDVWAAATGDRGAPEAGTVDHDDTEA